MPLWKKIWRRCASAFNRRFRRRNHVYRYEPGPGPSCPGLAVERYDRAEAVPRKVRAAVLRWIGGPASSSARRFSDCRN